MNEAYVHRCDEAYMSDEFFPRMLKRGLQALALSLKTVDASGGWRPAGGTAEGQAVKNVHFAIAKRDWV
jgi:hypothetical protein